MANEKIESKLIRLLAQLIVAVSFFIILVLAGLMILLMQLTPAQDEMGQENPDLSSKSISTSSSVSPIATIPPISYTTNFWKAPEPSTITEDEKGNLIKYGRELMANTAHYFGPTGKVKKINKGINCQNCHLDAGTKPFANNLGAVAANYPKFRSRSGTVETIEMRVNDCFERSLNGEKIPDNSKEMKALVAYIQWLGKDVPKESTPEGTGIYDLPLLDRAAKPLQGKELYAEKCQHCHLADGQGQKNSKGEYQYPPLWGDASFNTAAGLHRISKMAGFIKLGMPQGAGHDNVMLTDEQAWDIAAFVISQPRPDKKFKQDWPNISQKPIDHPFGPYTDGFSEEEHKYGPFLPILNARKKIK